MTELPKKDKLFIESNEKSLVRLALLLEISPNYGWQKRLAEKLGINQATISKWIKRGISKPGIRNIEHKGYPKNLWLITGNLWKEQPESSGKNKHDSNRGSFGLFKACG